MDKKALSKAMGEILKRLPEKEFEITIKSQVLSMNELRSLVQTWVKEYLEYMEPNEELHYFQYLKDSWFSEFRFVSSKGFENLFFPEKEDLVNQIDYFISNETWYKQKGLPYTLGFLFHGEPGCGKTSTLRMISGHEEVTEGSISIGDQEINNVQSIAVNQN